MTCHSDVSKGMILRYIVTVASFLALLGNQSDHIYLILPIVLFALDEIDNVFVGYDFSNLKNNIRCYNGFDYQMSDKVVDAMSYLLFLFLKFDYVTLAFIGYRIMGVLLFYATGNCKWLILFFDFVKEHMLYLYFFGKQYSWLFLFLGLKIVFEYYMHVAGFYKLFHFVVDLCRNKRFAKN